MGVFYRFMAKEGVSEVSVGRQEVADLVDKLTEAVKGGNSLIQLDRASLASARF